MTNPLHEEIDRKGTDSLKWEFIQQGEDLLHFQHSEQFFGPNRLLPMWVADMDFRCPDPVVEALRRRAAHGIFGYTAPSDAFYGSVANWMERRHGWKIEPQWICITPGVVPALNMLVRTFASPGDKVLIQPPVYYPFYSAIENNGAAILSNPLIYHDGTYRMDFADLAAKAKDPALRMAILCSPHNPVGRVWSVEELLRFGETCIENDVLVVSDEIHGDLIYTGSTFTPYAKVNQEFAQHSVVCTAPSKTFNLAGLQTSCIIIPNDSIRSQFTNTLKANGLFGINAFGTVALQAAYDHGEGWLEQVLDYIEGNLEYLLGYVSEHIPRIRVVRPQGTYLVWLDCHALGLASSDLRRLMLEDAQVYLDDGFMFGHEGEGFQRINIACPRSILSEALDRIRQAIDRLPESPPRHS
jgi:cystathionine beta-lyase